MNELNIFFTENETTSATSGPAATETSVASDAITETGSAEPTIVMDTTSKEMAGEGPVLTVGTMEEGEDAVLFSVDSAAPAETTATTQANLGFEPMNFVDNLQYMGVGMLTIFIVIGVIILTTSLINWIFSRKKD